MRRSEIQRRSGVGRAPESQPAPSAAVRAFIHDVVNPIAAIQASAGALRANAALTAGEMTDISRIEEAAGTIIRLVTNLGPARAGKPRARGLPAVTPSVDLYVLCCEVAAARRLADGSVIHCRAFGDPRGDWDRQQIAKLVSDLLDHAVAHLGQRAQITVSVIGMARHARLDIHGLGWLNARKVETSLDIASKIGAAPPGTTVNTIGSRNGGIVVRLRIPRWKLASPNTRRAPIKRPELP